jgi:heme oxygenase (biliverdin-IX-beta and delta-forming)
MDSDSQLKLRQIMTSQRVAALGTLREGGPLVSMVLFAPSEDFASIYIHVSRLAQHTQDIMKDPRVSLMVAEKDLADQDPQTIARISIRGEARVVPVDAAEFDAARAIYLKKFPRSAFNFELGDFSLYEIQPKSCRYVAGFAKTFNLTVEDLKRTAVTQGK